MPLDHHAALGRSGLRVGPMCLGTMTLGEDWDWGSSVAESEAILWRYGMPVNGETTPVWPLSPKRDAERY